MKVFNSESKEEVHWKKVSMILQCLIPEALKCTNWCCFPINLPCIAGLGSPTLNEVQN